MIVYRKSGIHHVLNIFAMDGSVFPRVFPSSLLCALIAAALHQFKGKIQVPIVFDDPDHNVIMKDTVVWQGFSFLVGFMIVFRTSMAYNRFWEGCTQLYQMRGEWLDACSSLIAFTKFPTQIDSEASQSFRHTIVILFSMLHSLALAEIEDSSSKMPEDVSAFRYGLIDPDCLDVETLFAIRNSEAKVELVFQWIQQVIVENMHCAATGKVGVLTIPPPILSRVFQELANGMICFQEAIKVSSIPFPFPYAQTCDCLLCIHWVITPLVAAHWFTSAFWAAIFTFIIVFIYWVLNSIAVEIENPFGPDANDIQCDALHENMNCCLAQLMCRRQQKTPTLLPGARWGAVEGEGSSARGGTRQSFMSVWAEHDPCGTGSPDLTRSSRHTSMGSNLTCRMSKTFSAEPTALRGEMSDQLSGRLVMSSRLSGASASSQRGSRSSSSRVSQMGTVGTGSYELGALALTSRGSRGRVPPDKDKEDILPALFTDMPSEGALPPLSEVDETVDIRRSQSRESGAEDAAIEDEQASRRPAQHVLGRATC